MTGAGAGGRGCGCWLEVHGSSLKLPALVFQGSKGKQEFDAGHLKARDGPVVRTLASQQRGPGSNQVASMP